MNNNEQRLNQLKQAVLQKKLKGRIPDKQIEEKYQLVSRTDPKQELPLSWAQQRLWFLAQLDPAAQTAYHVSDSLHLHGVLDLPALTAAFDRLVARHEILRTTFRRVDGQARQIIGHPDCGFALTVHDFSQLPAADQHAAVEAVTDGEASQPFDFSHGPLIRAQLLKLADHQHRLLLTQHHIITDGWSLNILLHELATLYRAFTRGQPDPLPPLPVQYADYALWQRQWLQGTVLETQLAFWRQALHGTPALLALPTDHPRPAVQSYRGDLLPFTLSPSLVAALKALSQRHGTTLFMTLLTGWGILLARLSGQPDIVIGTPVANRQHSALEPLIGFFVNTLALRVTVDDNPSVQALLARVKAHTVAAYAHQDLPFEQLVEALQPPRSLSHSPIFQVMFALDNTPKHQRFDLPGLTLTEMPAPRSQAQFDLTLSLNETAEGISGDLEYATDLFGRATIERLSGYLTQILTAMAADDRQPVNALPLLTPAQRHQVLVQFNATATDSPRETLIHQLIEQQAAATPAAPALVSEAGQLSYAALNRQANQLAHALRATGIRPDDRIALCADRSLEMIIGMLAILKAGASYVPLDPDYPTDRLIYLLTDSQPLLILTQCHLRARLAGTGLPIWVLDSAAPHTAIARHPQTNPAHTETGLTPAHLAYVLYTSGSTGQPKGVMVEHRQVVNFIQAQIQLTALTPHDRVLQFASFGFDNSVAEIFPTLAVGATLVLRPARLKVPDTDFVTFLHTHRITVVDLPTAFWHLWAQEVRAGHSAPPPALRSVAASGEKAEVRHLHAWLTHPAAQACRWINIYGPTETTVNATACPYEPGQRPPADDIPIGRPMANTTVYILDPQGQPVPVGVTGEIYIGGEGVARGYLNRPELTAERFLPDPFRPVPGARMYRTGDLGHWRPEGSVHYLGRNDFQVKLRGFRIELGEIETHLGACPGVKDALVIVREDDPGDKRLVAYLVPDTPGPLDAARLRDQLSHHLASYMIPGAFVTLAAFPLNPSGKIDRQALPAPDRAARVSRAYAAPQGEAEQQLAAVWQTLLQLAQVSRHDNFFELGGHSLLVVTLIEQLRQHRWTLPVSAVFAAPTLAAMARQLTPAPADSPRPGPPANLIPPDCPAITPAMLPLVSLTPAQIDAVVARVAGGARNVQDMYPLGPLQEGILFHYLLDTGSDTYLDRQFIRFDSRARLAQFLQALQQVIARHDILRSAVHWQDLPDPVQVVYRRAVLPQTEAVLVPGEAGEHQLRRLTDTRLDITRAPLLAATFAQEPGSPHWLLALQHHHLVCDHLSLEMIFNEMQALLAGQGDTLPPSLPYRHFIAQVRAVPAETHQAYFRQLLGDVAAPTLPFSLTETQHRPADIAEAVMPLEDALSQQITACARQQGVSAAVLFHVAWAQVLALCSGQDDIVFGTVLLGRLQGGAGTAQVFGMLINTLPVRIRLQDDTVQQAVQATHQQLSALLAHEQTPLALAQRCSGIPAPLPLFSSLLNFRHSQRAPEPAASPAWAGIQVLSDEEYSNYPLSLDVDAFEDGFALTAQCPSSLNPARINQYMVAALSQLVNALHTAPARAIRTLDVLPDEERHRLLVAFNPAAVTAPAGLLHQAVEQQAARTPAATALIGGDTSLSYAALNRRANQLAHALIAAGVRPDDRVAIYAGRSAALIIGLLGILKAGAGYVPLATDHPRERLAYLLSDSAPVLLLTQTHLQPHLPETPVPVWCLDEARQQASLETSPADNPQPARLGLQPHHLAYVIYTSGSTGLPKGVMVEHRHVTSFVAAQLQASPLTATDRVLQFTAVAFDTAVSEIFPTFAAGATLILRPDALHVPDSAFSAFLHAQKITVLDVPAAFWHLWVQELAAGRCPFSPDLRTVTVGGEKVEARHLHTWRALPETQPCRWLNAYGPTETTVTATVWAGDNTGQPPQMGPPVAAVPIGRPLSNSKLYILDAHGRPVPVGVTGEIYVGGAGVARGYLNRPDLTAERFIHDPFSARPGARMYRTGDLGHWRPDGHIHCLGRNDFQVKIRGFRIELGEIETQLAACPGVKEAAVIAREEKDGNTSLVAYIIPQSDITPDAIQLREQLGTHLMEYMLPSIFVTLDAFPLTPNGKIDRKALPTPKQTDVISREYQAPANTTEQKLAIIWQNLLQLKQVGRHDNFFELGGHSLLVVSLIEQLRQCGFTLQVSAVFSFPVLADMANHLINKTADDSTAQIIPPNLITNASQIITPDMLPLVLLTQEQIDQIVANVVGGVSNIQDIYPLGPLQEGILFHHLLETKGDIYLDNMMIAFDCRARLETFLQALQQIINRHDILRSAVHWNDLPEPVQVIYRQAQLPITELTLSPEGEAEQQLLHHTDPHLIRLNITQAPLLSATIAKDPHSGKWLLALLHHHLVCDHHSLEIIFNEIQTILLGQGNQLPPPLPYRNFIAQLRMVPLEQHQVYFRQLLADVDEPTLPFGLLEVHGENSEHFAETEFELETSLAQALRNCAHQQGVSTAVLFHVGWAQVLAQCSGRDDVVFGTVLLGRLQGVINSDKTLGMFMNTLPIRIKLGDFTVQQVVQQTYQVLSELLEHEQAPLSLAQQCSGVKAPLPLFNSLLNYRHSPNNDNDQNTRSAEEGIELLSSNERTNYPLSLAVDDTGQGFTLTMQCVSSLDPKRINAFILTVLYDLVKILQNSPEHTCRQLNILPQEERIQLLQAFNNTHIEYSQDVLIHQRFEQQVEYSPTAIALIYGDQQLCYDELNRKANQLAHYLISLGIRPDDRVAICVERSLDMVIGLLGILKAGAGYVPLDPDYPTERLSYMLSDSRPVVLLTQYALQVRFFDTEIPLLVLDDSKYQAKIRNQPDYNLSASDLGITSRNLAYVLYTSGSTGLPKGVMIEHISVVNLLLSMQEILQITIDDTMLFSTTIGFDIAGLELYLPLFSGSRIVLASSRIAKDPEQLAAFIALHNIKIVQATPTAWRMLLDSGWIGADIKALSGGEALSHELAQRLKQKVSSLWNLYGPTETTIWSTVSTNILIEQINHHTKSQITIGRPIANTQIYLLDQHNQPVPIGVVGEIHIGGIGVARGYLNRPELTNERFVHNPFSEQVDARMYKTGDLGRWLPDGTIDYLGRNDFQVKIRGFRIELGEIEAKLLAYPGIQEAIVMVREDITHDKRLVAYLVLQPEMTLNLEQLRETLHTSLPHYMIPNAFVTLDSFPLTPNGKLDRQSLPSPDAFAVITQDYEAPDGEIENIIAEIWQENLRLDRIGRHDHFFELGGHSLLTLQIVTRLRRALDINIAIRDLFLHPTISKLACYLQQLLSGSYQEQQKNIVTIRQGKEESSLLLVHPAGGGIHYAYDLAAHIHDQDMTIYGITASDRFGDENLQLTFSEMAKEYITSIRQAQIPGPYTIAGWSIGGTLAYEIANQLIAEGETVNFIGLIDSIASYQNTFTQEEKQTGLLFNAKNTLYNVLAEEIDISPHVDEKLQRITDKYDYNTLLAFAQQNDLLPPQIPSDNILYYLSLYHNIMVAAYRYIAPTNIASEIPLHVVLFRATEQNEQHSYALGWEDVIPPEQLSIVHVVGSHESIMKLPHIKHVGQALLEAIMATKENY
ncbi:non-ribosomal peptide synthetase [Xenorhabdus indica]|uniref:non-ribosomal peptide synthetase n=1 Tax=Xenorhabdus indica TaxID=333964 RepID=UPI001656E045|nr:non-ribosomal peptide synthetase [Xenorhabdus indica]MBC8943738.1 Amino acid adenylation [Xenorhabdus indica]